MDGGRAAGKRCTRWLGEVKRRALELRGAKVNYMETGKPCECMRYNRVVGYDRVYSQSEKNEVLDSNAGVSGWSFIDDRLP